jgi:hypothetical protein
MDPAASLTVTAYRLPAAKLTGTRIYPEIRPASPDRFWMDFSTRGWANRCLPLRIANQYGWEILNPLEFEVKWNGKTTLDGLNITFKEGRGNSPSSMFGYGVVTWTIPFLFVTPPGWNLLVRGTPNFWKDGAAPLEGLVEADWLPYTFTMSWKITRPSKTVRFEKGDPICLITPVRRGDVESFVPSFRNLESEPRLHAQYNAWHDRRLEAASYETEGRKAVKNQGQYIRGEQLDKERFSNHQTKLVIKPFEDLEPVPRAVSLPVVEPSPQKPGFWQRLRRR